MIEIHEQHNKFHDLVNEIIKAIATKNIQKADALLCKDIRNTANALTTALVQWKYFAIEQEVNNVSSHDSNPF